MTSASKRIAKLTESLDLAIQALYCIAQQYGDDGQLVIDSRYAEFLRIPKPMVFSLEQTVDGINVTAETATAAQVRDARKELKRCAPNYYKPNLEPNPMIKRMFGQRAGGQAR